MGHANERVAHSVLRSDRGSTRLWVGRIISAVPVLFLTLDAVIKLMKVPAVVEAFGRLGVPLSLAPGIGILALICTAVYVVPRTTVLGAVLLTGYLGGAVATQVRAQSGVFEVIFPIIIAALVWGGLFLRDDRLRAFLPLRG
jgi:DoxX-like protein